MGPGTLSYYIEVSKCPNEAGKTLGPGTLSYCIEDPKSPKDAGKTLGPGTMSLGIEVPKSPKEAGKTLRPGTLSYYIEVPKSAKEGSTILGPGKVAPRNGGRSGTGRKRRSSGDGDGREAPTTLRPLPSSLPPFLLAQSYADLIAKLLLHLRDLDRSPVAGKAIAKDLPRRLEIREQQQ